MILHSYAKLNLYLVVLGRRKDGYHNLLTLFERISLCDRITLTLRIAPTITISCDSPHLPRDERNLAYKSARLLQKSFGVSRGVDIRIEKRIPIASGLGGGSSNAACVLRGLNRLWKLRLTKKELFKFARRLGSDVPFFIYDVPFAIARARGDAITTLPALKNVRLWQVVVVPRLGVSTASIYNAWDEKRDKNVHLTREKEDVRILTLRLRQKRPVFIAGLLYNSLQEITSGLYLEVQQVLRELNPAGLQGVLMSGSGPAVFGILSSRKEALGLAGRLKKKNRSWQVFAVRTI